MAGYRSAHQQVILFREYFYDLQALHLYSITTHTAGHADAFHYTGSIRGVTQGTGSTLTVMLTVRLLAYAMESMTFYDTLETFTLRSTYDFDLIAFGKDVHGDGITKVLFYGLIA